MFTPSHLQTLFAPFEASPSLLLAISGGPDSLALLHLCHQWTQTLPTPPRLFASTMDHGLRPDSRTEAEQVGLWAAALNISHHILIWQGPKPTTRLQERARRTGAQND